MSNSETSALDPGSSPVAEASSPLASILVIDDEVIVCNTLSALLKAEGFDVVTAKSGREGVELLRGRRFEVVIVDLMMPGMDGIEAIAALKQVDPDVEVIILTGHVTVNSTIAALRQGACDFLPKPTGMAQLRPAVLRALEKRRGEVRRGEARSRAVIETAHEELLNTFGRDSTERKQVMEALQASEAKLKVIFEGVEAGIFLIDPQTHRIVEANPPALQLVGADRDAVVGAVCHKFVCPADCGRCPVTDLKQDVDNSERILLTAKGERRPIIKTVKAVVIDGRPLLLESFVDISARKKAEQALKEAEEHFHSLFASIPLPTFFFDAETLQYLEVNDAALSASGYSRDEILKMRVLDLAPPEAAHSVTSRIQTLLPGTLEHGEGRYRLKDGRLVDVESDFRTLDFHGHKAVLAVSQDVTARKRAEAEMAERHRLGALVAEVGVALTRAESMRQGLQKCAEIMVRIIGAAFARFWTVNEEEKLLELQASAGMYTHIDGGHARVPIGEFKIGRIAMSGEAHLSNAVQEDPEVGNPEWARREGMVAFAGYPLKVEDRILGVAAAFSRQPLSEATLQAFAAVADNTAQFIRRKRAEEALRESEDRYRDLVENSLVLIGTHDPNGRILSLNCAAARLLEARNADELAGRLLTDYVPPDLLPQFEEYLKTILRDGHAEGLMVLVTPSGKRKIVGYRNTLRRQDLKEPIVRWTGQDVTERIQAEKAQALLASVVESSQDAIITVSPEGTIASWNPGAQELYGYRPEEIIGKPVLVLTPPELAEQTTHFMKSVLRGERVSDCETVRMCRDGRRLDVSITISPTLDPKGNITGSASIARDITARKCAEDQTRLQTAALESAANGITITDREGRIIWVNPAFTRLTGYSASEVIGQTPRVLKSGTHNQAFYKKLWKTILSGEVWQGELVNRRKDGTRYSEEMTITPVRDEGGAITHFVAIKQDITERKRAEEELRLTQFSMEHASDSILLMNPQGRIVYVNRAACQALGRSREELLSLSIPDIDPNFPPGAWDEAWERVKALGSMTLETFHQTKQGRIFPVEVSSNYLNFGGKEYSFAFARDITERKRAHDALCESNELVNLLLASIPEAVYGIDLHGNCTFCNPSCLELLGYQDAADLLGKDMHALIHHSREDGSLYPVEECHIFEAFRRGQGTHIDDEVIWRRDGSSFPAEYWSHPLRRNENVIGSVVTFVDITERKRAEAALQESEQRYRLLFSQMLVGFALLEVIGDENGVPIDLRYLEINTAFEKHTGMARDKVVGRTIRETLPDIEPFWIETYGKVGATGESIHFESYAQPLLRWFEVTAFRLHPGRVAVTFADVTERKLAEEQTRIQTAALESAANAIAITDREGRMLWVNPAFTRLTGYPAGEVLGQTMRILNSGKQSGDFYRNLWQTVLSGQVWQGELINRRKDGTLYTDDMTITPVYDASGTPTHFVTIKQDVTERRLAEQSLEERTVYLNTLFEISPLGIVVIDTQGSIQMSNPAFERLFHYTRPEIMGAKLDDFIVPPELASEARTVTGHCLSGPGASITTRRLRKDGTLVDVDIYGVPLVIDGKLRGVLALYQDITERRRAEEDLVQYAEDLEVAKAAQEENAQRLARLVEELAEERDLLGTLMDNLPDHIYYKDRQARFLRTNTAHARALGVGNPQQVVGKTDFDFFPEEAAQGYFTDDQQVIESGQPLIGRIEKVPQPDGQVRWHFTSKVPIRDAQGRATGLVGISRDITERLQAEEKVRESEAKYRSLISNIPDVIWTMDADLHLVFLSTNIERLSGVSLEQHYRRGGELFLESVHPEDAGKVKEGLSALFARGEPYDVECRVRRKDGEWIWVHDRAVATYEKNGIRYADGLLTDISPSKRAEETLRASEERYRELFENASDIVYTTGLDTRLTSLNRVGQITLGYSEEEAVLLDLYQLVVPKHWDLIKRSREQLVGGVSDITIEVEVTTKDGRLMTLEVKPRLIYKGGKPVGVQGIGRDITGRDAAELELRHAQKLESVGRLASGIAHEINTPIQFVGDNTSFLQDSFHGLETLLRKYREMRDAAASGAVSPKLLAEVRDVEEKSDCAYLLEEIPQALSQTLDGVERVATIVRAMKEFAHPESKDLAAADLNRALQSTLTVARNELKYVADVETEFGELPLVVCNVGDLNQVFLNLLVNAAHAISEGAKGTGERGKIRVCTAAEGNNVVVTISDTGCGIPEANRSRVFDPFFTTKEVGRGTGQGLAIARSVVVDRHKGTLTFESEVGKGTTFTIRLPIDPGESSKEVRVP